MLATQRDHHFISNVVHISDLTLGDKIEDVYNGVHTGKIIGSGVSGVVREVKHKKTGVLYAAKCLDLGTIRTEFALSQVSEVPCVLVVHE